MESIGELQRKLACMCYYIPKSREEKTHVKDAASLQASVSNEQESHRKFLIGKMHVHPVWLLHHYFDSAIAFFGMIHPPPWQGIELSPSMRCYFREKTSFSLRFMTKMAAQGKH